MLSYIESTPKPNLGICVIVVVYERASLEHHLAKIPSIPNGNVYEKGVPG